MAFHENREREDSRRVDHVSLASNASLAEALHELYQLLEQYAPPWYTQEHHEKACLALRAAKKI